MSRRPAVLIPARFSASASALRHGAEVAPRALVEAVFAAGGEPLLAHPHAPGAEADLDDVRERLSIADAVLLPGGGDLDPSWSGQAPHPAQYDVDLEQDAFDLAVARVALDSGLPLLAVCRGAQVVNVLLGGTTRQDMAPHHRHHVHEVDVAPGSRLAAIAGPVLTASCYHHQAAARLGRGLAPTARAADATVEALELPGRPGWFLATQFHPEDHPAQTPLFTSFLAAARRPV